ncbi:hypothetical protein D3C75_652870 [compost metagenome]
MEKETLYDIELCEQFFNPVEVFKFLIPQGFSLIVSAEPYGAKLAGLPVQKLSKCFTIEQLYKLN